MKAYAGILSNFSPPLAALRLSNPSSKNQSACRRTSKSPGDEAMAGANERYLHQTWRRAC